MNRDTELGAIEIVRQIQEVVHKTEAIFDGIAELFPRLSKELDSSREDSDHQIKRLEAGNISFHDQNTTSSLLSRTRIYLEDAAASFHDLHSRDNILLTTLHEDVEEVRNLDKRIQDIRESSESMELISLNAMTVAAKAGKAGGAFGYITEELKRISARSIVYTQELTREGAEIDKTFNGFLASMEKVEAAQETLFNNFGQFINEGFEKAGEATSGAIGFLKKIASESEAVKEPLIQIMQQVQHQDIIRQALDHVVLALGELKEADPEEEKPSVEDELDELYVMKTIPRLCEDLLDDVAMRIKESHSHFYRGLEEIQKHITEIDEKVNAYKRGNSISNYFSQAGDSINDIKRNVASSLEMKEEISSKSEMLLTRVNNLNESFTDFSELVGQFQNITVASKIEIAKQEALSSMESTVEEMYKLTAFIDQTVEEALQSIRKFFKRTRDSLELYRVIYRQESIFAQTFDKNMGEISIQLSEDFSGIEGAINNFSAYTERFINTYRDTELLLRRLYDCSGDLKESKSLLTLLGQTYSSSFDRLLRQSGYSQWTLRNQRLQHIIERFTILEHKKTAGRIGGFEVEEGNESGDVTFF
jgi:methyl-accepting chemotaxis protein